QVHSAPHAQSHVRNHPRGAPPRRNPSRRPEHPRAGRYRSSPPRWHGLPAPQSFPQVHFRQRGLRPENQRLQSSHLRRRRKKPAPRRALGRSKGSSPQVRLRTFRPLRLTPHLDCHFERSEKSLLVFPAEGTERKDPWNATSKKI